MTVWQVAFIVWTTLNYAAWLNALARDERAAHIFFRTTITLVIVWMGGFFR